MKGDLSRLSEHQRLEYYNSVCKSLGLNPLTRPFEYLTLNGKLTLYARRDAAEQLRKINGISVELVSKDFKHGLLTVHVRARDKDGRTDEDLGVVAFPESMKGEIAANAILKCVTKAKRRVTLSLSGLGFLSEEEVEDIPAEAKQAAPPTEETLEPFEIPLTQSHGSVDWRQFGAALAGYLRLCENKHEVFQWLEANDALLKRMASAVPQMHNKLQETIEAIKNEPT